MNVTTLTASCQARLEPSTAPQVNDSQKNRRNEQLLVDDGNNEDWRNTRRRSKPSKQMSVVSFTLTLPSWLAHRSLKVDVYRVAQSWTLSLRPYREVSRDSFIWQAIECGDFDRMRDLIESGQATIFDRDDYGTTLLHVCALCLLSYASNLFTGTWPLGAVISTRGFLSHCSLSDRPRC